MDGVVYDGESARARPVTAVVDDAGLTLTDGGSVERIDRDLLRRGSRGRDVLHRRDRPDWRFVAGAALPRAWLANLPDVGALSPAMRRVYVAAIVVVVGIVGGLARFGDDLLAATAPLVPSRITQPIGDAMIASLNAPRCGGAAGNAALARLVARLRPSSGFVEPVEVTVVDTAAVNAVTAPGGRVAIFRGLIDRAQGPAEVAGVLAHELTHVALRHPTKALLRQMGVSLFIRAMGGDVGNAADVATFLQSSRHAEAAADDGAIKLLRAAHVSPAGLAAFFARIEADDRRAPHDVVSRAIALASDFAATHPGSVDRERRILSAVAGQGTVTPALDQADWTALRSICRPERD